MPAQATTSRNHVRRFTRALLLGVAGSIITTAAAQAQACPSGSSGGTETISTSCPAITLSNNTSLVVTSAGSTTSIIGAGSVGNITVNGSVKSTGTSALNRGTATSIGAVTLGAGSKISATDTIFAVDYRGLRTLASFTNDGEFSSDSSGFGTANTSINGNVINNNKMSTVLRAFEIGTGTVVNGDVRNNGEITTTSTLNIAGSGIILNRARVTGNVVNTNQMNGANGGVTYGFLIYSNSNIGGAFTNSGTISGYNQGAFLQNSILGGSVINAASGVIDTVGVGLNLENVTATSLQNLNKIKSGSVGMRVEGGTLGALLNSGKITLTGANSAGITSSGVTYNGSVTNSGAITSLGSGMILSGGAVSGNVINTATGTIDTTAASGTNVGLSVTDVAVTGNLANDGRITGVGAGRAGVFASGGSIGGNLSNRGTISGYTTGISVSSTTITGAVSNTATGSITATGVGVNLSGVTAASLQNLGSIAAVTQGLNVSGGTLGSLTNGGPITTTGTASENNGIYLLGGARVTGDLTNSNLISGAAGAGGAKTSGIRLNSASLGGSLLSSGEIKGYNYGIQLESAPVTGSVSNSGKITAVDDGVLSTSSVSGGVKNLAGGTIAAGGYGFNLNAAGASYGGVLNEGAMTTVLSGVRANTVTVNGDVVNSGAIDTSGAGATSNGVELRTVTLSGNLTNSGQIRGQAGTNGATTAGVLTSGGAIGGGVTNSGSIAGYNVGMSLSNTPVTGSVSNSGKITAVDDGVLSTSSVSGGVKNLAGGTIAAGGYGFNLNAAGASYGGVLNEGAMTTVLSGVRANTVTVNGDVVNSGTIDMSGAGATSNGVELRTVTLSGNLTNSGQIRGQAGTNGATTAGVLTSGGAIGGGVTNSGSIAGYNVGMSLSNTPVTGSVSNSGKITAVDDGVLSTSSVSGGVKNLAGGTIAAGGYGFNLNAAGASYGGVLNDGAMTTVLSGVRANTVTVNGDVVNSGTIDTSGTGATSNGVELQTVRLSGNLTNSGQIRGQAGTNGATTAGVLTSGGAVGGGVTNSGRIAGYNVGMSLSNTPVTGAVANAATGVIEAAGVGVNLSGVTAASLQNLGSIAAVTQGLNVSGGTLGSLTNGGPITTTGTASENNGIYLLGGARVTGDLTNSNLISGAAGAGGAKTSGIRLNSASLGGSLLSSGEIKGYNYGIQISSAPVTGSVSNSGKITAVDDGVQSTSSITGGVRNLAGGTIEAGANGFGVNLSGAANSFGGILNAGRITSGQAGLWVANTTVTADVVNSGTINTTGAGSFSYGVGLSGATLTGNLSNSGQLNGAGGASRAGIWASGRSIGGAVTNSGGIAGYDIGMSLSNMSVTGAVANAATGVIEAAGVGVNLSGVTAASLQNLGSIAAVTQGLNVSGGTLGSLTNGGPITTTGTASENNGIYLLGGARVTGDLTNSNLISGAAGAGGAKTSGIRLNSASLGGSLLSSGEIRGYNYGIRISSAPVTGSVSNSGKITSVDDGVLSTSSVSGGVKNLAGGTIAAGGYGFNLNAAGASYGGVLNEGAMTTVLSGVRANTVTVNGDVVNSGTIDTSGAGATSNGVELRTVTLSGNLTNSGQIRGQAGTNGATTAGVLTSGGSIAGVVTNSRSISGYDYGLWFTNTPIAGALTNSGGVTSVADAVALSGSPIGGDVSNTSTGVISAGGYGFNIANFGSMGAFTNAGSITSGNSAMFASSGTINGDVLNAGAITTTGMAATSNGIELRSASVTGSLINSATMNGQAGTNGATTAGVLTSGGSIAGVVINSGSISGYDYGLWFTNTPIAGALTNSGFITSVRDAVALSGSSIGGDVANTSTGVISAGGYGFNIANFGSMGAFTNAGSITSGNSAMFASTGTINGDVLNAGAITTTGTAATSNGIELRSASVTGSLINSATMNGQAGTNGATTAGVLTSGGSIAGVVINSGSISGYDYGLWFTNTPIAGALTNSGFITSVRDAVALSGSSIGGDVANTSTGVIRAGGYGFNIVNFGSMGAFTNAGSITSGNSAMFASTGTINGDVLNAGAITTTGTAATSNGIELRSASVTGGLFNSGTMNGQAGTNGATTTGVLANGGAIAGGIRNSGGISGYTDGVALTGASLGGAIDNLGIVNAERYGYNLADAGTIAAFNNFGTIAAGVAGVSATGVTQIQNLTNAQGVGNSAGPLTYSGTLPTNYFIVINGGNYGQLGVDPANHSGKMTFAISSLSTGVAPRTYSTVLTGVSSADLTNPDSVQARFGDRGKLVLRRQGGSATTWDLALEGYWNPFIGNNNPNVVTTYQAMNINRLAIQGAIHQRYAVLNAVMQYDCDRFDKYGVCVQFQTRQTGFGTQSSGSGVINASYRIADRFRFGAYLDYQTWARSPFGVAPASGGVQQADNHTTYGGYVGYSENIDQSGLQARASGGYNQGRVNIVRAFLKGSEPGFGDAGLNGYYAYGVVGYGLKLGERATATPYVGLQYTSVTREAYSESLVPETIFPLTYYAYYERLITGLAGAKLSGMLDEKLGYEAALGGQFDLGRNANAFGGWSMAPGLESFGMVHGGVWNGVRPSGMAGVSYAPLPHHRLSLNGYVNQQAWTTRTYASALLGYQLGF